VHGSDKIGDSPRVYTYLRHAVEGPQRSGGPGEGHPPSIQWGADHVSSCACMGRKCRKPCKCKKYEDAKEWDMHAEIESIRQYDLAPGQDSQSIQPHSTRPILCLLLLQKGEVPSDIFPFVVRQSILRLAKQAAEQNNQDYERLWKGGAYQGVLHAKTALEVLKSTVEVVKMTLQGGTAEEPMWKDWIGCTTAHAHVIQGNIVEPCNWQVVRRRLLQLKRILEKGPQRKGLTAGKSRTASVFECHVNCGCLKNECKNRDVQSGMKASVEVFMTTKKGCGGKRCNGKGCNGKPCGGKGWGVRTTEPLGKDTFVFEYAGEIINHQQFQARTELESGLNRPMYFFELQTGKSEKEKCYIDAQKYGNASRFLNNSCKDANLIGVNVYTNHHDSRVPTLAFFTTRDIPKNEELTISYGDTWKENHMCVCKSCLASSEEQSEL